MRKTWLVPIVIIVILMVSWFNRWEYTATNTVNHKIIKWKTDHWTGQVWMETYRPPSIMSNTSEVKIEPIQPLVSDNPKKTEVDYTTYWILFIGFNVLWLLFAIMFSDKSKEKESNIGGEL